MHTYWTTATMSLRNSIRKFFRDSDAATATEYAVMLGLILAVLIVGLSSAGSGVSGWWTKIDTDLQSHGF